MRSFSSPCLRQLTHDSSSAAAAQGVQVERLVPRGADLTGDQRAAMLEDAPELAALLQELKDSLQDVRFRIGPLIKEVRLCALLRTMPCEGKSCAVLLLDA